MQKIITTNKKQFCRKSIRLQNFDYSSEGWYFVTICTLDRKPIFGNIENEKMSLNNNGVIVKSEWLQTAKLRNNVRLDDFVIMPDHFHGIIMLSGPTNNWQVAQICENNNKNSFQRKYNDLHSGTLSTIIRAFKAATTKSINEAQNTYGTKLWQRNYYEHIIRDEYDLYFTREYIKNNPHEWNNKKN